MWSAQTLGEKQTNKCINKTLRCSELLPEKSKKEWRKETFVSDIFASTRELMMWHKMPRTKSCAIITDYRVTATGPKSRICVPGLTPITKSQSYISPCSLQVLNLTMSLLKRPQVIGHKVSFEKQRCLTFCLIYYLIWRFVFKR